jgi:hypothetical protein
VQIGSGAPTDANYILTYLIHACVVVDDATFYAQFLCMCLYIIGKFHKDKGWRLVCGSPGKKAQNCFKEEAMVADALTRSIMDCNIEEANQLYKDEGVMRGVMVITDTNHARSTIESWSTIAKEHQDGAISKTYYSSMYTSLSCEKVIQNAKWAAGRAFIRKAHALGVDKEDVRL